MIKQMILNFLNRKLQEKKYEVIQMKWEKIEFANLKGVGR